VLFNFRYQRNGDIEGKTKVSSIGNFGVASK